MKGEVDHGDDSTRLHAFERRVERPRQILALVWLPVLVGSRVIGSPSWLAILLAGASNLIWAFFLVELLVRLRLAPRTGVYIRSHLFDLAALGFPPLRAIWAVRGVRSVLQQPGLAFFLACTVGVVATAATLVFVIERDAVGANIDSLGDAVWWAFVTATTVGYGDHTPVSGLGRLLAGGLMLVGVVLYSVVTAHIAAYVIGRTRSAADEAILERIDHLATQVRSLEHEVARVGLGRSGDDAVG